MGVNLNHGSGFNVRPRTISDDINDAIDAGLMRARANEPKRSYLGGSRFGESCKRMLCYEYAGVPVDPEREIGPRQLRIFATGHALEAAASGIIDQGDADSDDLFEETWKQIAAKWLRDAGFDLLTGTPDGKQFEVTALDGKIQMHIDGFFRRSPIPLLTGAGWEHKGINQKTFSKIIKHGVKIAHEVYHGQMQTYMGYFKLPRFLATFTNKNTSEQWHELVEFDPSCCQRLSDSALDVIRAVEGGNILPRIAKNSDFFKCKLCNYPKRCWSDNR